MNIFFSTRFFTVLFFLVDKKFPCISLLGEYVIYLFSKKSTVAVNSYFGSLILFIFADSAVDGIYFYVG